jgi:predicted N-acetyltransferase YhbS
MSGWTTRVETAEDLEAIRSLLRAAFPTDAEADLVDALRADPAAWIEGLSVVSVDADGTVVGYALLTRGHVDDVPVVGLGPCAVLPSRQRSGAGSAAIRAALANAAALGERFVVVLGHADYYPRFGFTRASLHGIRLTIDAPDEAVMALALDGRQPLPSGTMRYAAAFGI